SSKGSRSAGRAFSTSRSIAPVPRSRPSGSGGAASSWAADGSIYESPDHREGPILIGQAAEFDYAGTQACRALREEGIETVLVNSNPATIMTDPGVADITYLEPLTVDVLERIIEKEIGRASCRERVCLVV